MSEREKQIRQSIKSLSDKVGENYSYLSLTDTRLLLAEIDKLRDRLIDAGLQ